MMGRTAHFRKFAHQRHFDQGDSKNRIYRGLTTSANQILW